MRAIQKGILSVLILLFVFFSLRYAFFVPHEPHAVYHAIPTMVTAVTHAQNMDELLKSPLGQQLQSILTDERQLHPFLEEQKTVADWVERVTPSEIALATLPNRSETQRNTILMTSWVGWRSPWLRWKLERTRAKGLTRLGKHNVWPIWALKSSQLQAHAFTFSITDTLFIACFSDDPMDLLLALETYDKRSPAYPLTPKEPTP